MEYVRWDLRVVRWCSRWDLNPDHRLRRPVFYPLNYGSGTRRVTKGEKMAGGGGSGQW